MYPCLVKAQQQTDWVFKATSDSTFTWVSPAALKTTLGVSNVTGTWGDTSRVNIYTQLAAKQALLVSGTNIKTVNGNNLLGSGDISISGTAAWGSVTGTLSNQSDLQTALNGKQASGSYAVTTNNLSDLSNAGTARTNLGLAIGTNVQAFNSNLSTIAGLTPTTNNFIVSVSSAWASRTPTEVKVTLALDNVTNESKTTMLNNAALGGTPTGIGLPVYARVVTSNATTTGQALTTITGLSIALVANAVYEVECMLSVSTSAVTTGTGYGINYSAAGATIEGFVQGSSTTTADKTLRLNAFNTSSQAWITSSAQTGGILIKATVTVGANAGNLTAQHLKVTSGTSTVFISSYMKATRIL
jgi:hypothetical protein